MPVVESDSSVLDKEVRMSSQICTSSPSRGTTADIALVSDGRTLIPSAASRALFFSAGLSLTASISWGALQGVQRSKYFVDMCGVVGKAIRVAVSVEDSLDR